MINYYLVTKPGIVLGNLVTLTAGFLLASKGAIHFGLFLAAFIGLALVMASACVFNNYIDRSFDKKMKRTKDRALVQGVISEKNAIFFAAALGFLGFSILLLFTNLVAVAVTGVGFFVYVVLYSLWKSKTIYGTAIGSVAGAVPPVVGYCAVSNSFDLGAAILFLMLVLWQMPHFFAIAMYHFEDYTAAGLPVLPVMKGSFRTKIHMLIYIVAFIIMSIMLTAFNYTGYLYVWTALALGLSWLCLCLQGFITNVDDQAWGRNMFRLSLVLIGILSFAIPYDVIK